MMAPNFDEPKPRQSKFDLAKLKALYEAAGLKRPVSVEHTEARTTRRGQKWTRGWSEVTCHNPEERGQSQVAHCCDPDDADFIGAIINAFPFIVEELERPTPAPTGSETT